jgi:serine protease Do
MWWMRGPILLVLLSAIAACAHAPKAQPAQPAAQAALTPAEIAARALPAVVTMRTQQSFGTGFVVRDDGWIATNLHVVVGGPQLKVTLRDGRQLDVVEVLNASTDYDLVLVRVEAKGLPTLKLGDSDAMRPGDPVVAIGNPMGLEDTVSNGLLSSRRKDEETGVEILQVSAPISPGSSGGPLFNDRGEVIGIAQSVLVQGQNLNFAVPTRYLLPMMKQPDPVPFSEFAALIAQMVAAHRQAAAAHQPKQGSGTPRLPLSVLDGCSQDAQRLVVKMLGDAIHTGAPLYNAHNPDGCYHVYDGAASDLERKLPPTCKGPVRFLAEVQKRAGAMSDPDSQAWAMRHAFDGLLEAIARKQEQ